MGKGIFPKVFAIVLNYNGKETLLECIKSLYHSSYPNLEIVVVDNDSTDKSIEIAKKKYPNIHYVLNTKNIGFSAGNNIGIRFALEKFADYVFLLNNDARISKRGITDLVAVAEKKPLTGIINPLILNHDGTRTWFSGGNIHWLRMKTTHGSSHSQTDPTPIGYATGCAMLIKKNVFKKIGLFDEDYFLYYEDADFSHRAAQSGFEILLVPRVKVFHRECSNVKNSRKTYWLVLSALLFFKKNSPFWLRVWHSFYCHARRFKNSADCALHKNDNCLLVREAYKDFARYEK